MHIFAQCKSLCLRWTCRYSSFQTLEKRNKKKIKNDTNGDQKLLFNSRLNVVFFCRNINIGKITGKKHKWFVNVETGGLSDTLKFIEFILLKSSIVGSSEMKTRDKSLSFAF